MQSTECPKDPLIADNVSAAATATVRDHNGVTSMSLGADPDMQPRMVFKMDSFDWDVLEFVVNWSTYGGPPVDRSLIDFGMTRQQLLDRFCELTSAVGRDTRQVPPNRHALAHAALSYGRYLRSDQARHKAVDNLGVGEWVIRRGVHSWSPTPKSFFGAAPGSASASGDDIGRPGDE